VALSCSTQEASEYQISKITELRGLEALTTVLDLKETELLPTVIDAISNIMVTGECGMDDENMYMREFDSYNGHDKIIGISMSDNKIISNKANAFIENFYGIEDLELLRCYKEALNENNSDLKQKIPIENTSSSKN